MLFSEDLCVVWRENSQIIQFKRNVENGAISSGAVVVWVWPYIHVSLWVWSHVHVPLWMWSHVRVFLWLWSHVYVFLWVWSHVHVFLWVWSCVHIFLWVWSSIGVVACACVLVGTVKWSNKFPAALFQWRSLSVNSAPTTFLFCDAIYQTTPTSCGCLSTGFPAWAWLCSHLQMILSLPSNFTLTNECATLYHVHNVLPNTFKEMVLREGVESLPTTSFVKRIHSSFLTKWIPVSKRNVRLYQFKRM